MGNCCSCCKACFQSGSELIVGGSEDRDAGYIPVQSAGVPVQSAGVPVQSAGVPVQSAGVPEDRDADYIPVHSAGVPLSALIDYDRDAGSPLSELDDRYNSLYGDMNSNCSNSNSNGDGQNSFLDERNSNYSQTVDDDDHDDDHDYAGIIFSSKQYPVSVGTKYETLEFLKITAVKGNVHHVLHEVARALPKLDVAFDVQDYPSGFAHRRSSASPICHSLRVLELTVGQLPLKDLVSVMDVVSALYPNIQHLTINVKDQYKSDEKSIIDSVSLQLHHLEDLTISSTGMDLKAEQDLKMTMHELCPQLAPATSQDGVYFFRRMYGVSGYLDHLGGELSIPAHSVKLSIPSGALEDSEKISIEVFTDLPNGINLQDNEIAASFGFRCFPSGSSFKKPLTLSMPHCAVINDNKSVGMVLHFGSNVEGEIRRIPLDSNRYVIHDDRIELQLDHFSWGILTLVYNWLFPATKRMLCTPFVPETLPENQDCPTLRLRFYDQLPGLPEKIIAEEESLKYKKIYPEEELIVKERSIDMSISCQSKELSSTQTKVITAKELMQHAKLSVCMTLLQRSSLVTLIITQEREITMTFSTDIKEASPSVGEVEGMVTPVQSVSYKAAPPRSPDAGYTREVSPSALVPYVPTQEVECTQQGACRYQRRLEDHRSLDPDCLTDDQLVDISRKLPLDKFNPISIKLGFTMTETRSIRSLNNEAEEMYFTVLTRWKERTGAPKRQLIDVLRSVKLFGIVQSMGLEHDSSQEDVESIC